MDKAVFSPRDFRAMCDGELRRIAEATTYEQIVRGAPSASNSAGALFELRRRAAQRLGQPWPFPA
jgi:hypothetical protein